MIKITKGNPTPEEIAALVAVLTLASGTTELRRTSSTAGEWRRSTRFGEVNPSAPCRWRPWSAGWSCVGPAHAPVPHRAGSPLAVRHPGAGSALPAAHHSAPPGPRAPPTVSACAPVATATRLIPPRPSTAASAPSTSRRAFSSRCGRSNSYLRAISSSVTPATYTRPGADATGRGCRRSPHHGHLTPGRPASGRTRGAACRRTPTRRCPHTRHPPANRDRRPAYGNPPIDVAPQAISPQHPLRSAHKSPPTAQPAEPVSSPSRGHISNT